MNPVLCRTTQYSCFQCQSENPVDYSPMRTIGEIFATRNPIAELEDMERDRKKYQYRYHVEYLDGAEWVRHHSPISLIAAEANYDVLIDSGRHARIVYQGKTIKEGKKGDHKTKQAEG